MVEEEVTKPFILSKVDKLDNFNIRECIAFMRYLQSLESAALRSAENKINIQKLEKRFKQLMVPS